MSQEQQKNTYADSNSMAAGDTQMKTMNSIVPGSKKTKTISIYNPFTEKMSRVAPYSAKAKKIYRYYIKELGYDPAWIVPGDLKFHNASSRFTYSLRTHSLRRLAIPPRQLRAARFIRA